MLERIYNYPASLIYTDKEDIEDYLNSKEPIDKLLIEIYQRAVDNGLYEEDPVRFFNDVYRCAIIIANTHNYRLLPVLDMATEKCFPDYQDNDKWYVVIEMLKVLVCSQKWIDNVFWLRSFKKLEKNFITNPYIFSAVNPAVEDAIKNPRYNTDLYLKPKPISRWEFDKGNTYVHDWLSGRSGNSDVKWDDLMYILGCYRHESDRLMFVKIIRDSKTPYSKNSFGEMEDRLKNGTFDSWWCDKFNEKQSPKMEHQIDYIDNDLAKQLDNSQRALKEALRTAAEYRKKYEESRDEVKGYHKKIELYKEQLKKASEAKMELDGCISISCIADRFKKKLEYSSHDIVSKIFDEMDTLLRGDQVWEAHKDEIVKILAKNKATANAMSVGDNHGIIAENLNLRVYPETETRLLDGIRNKH